MSAKRGLTRQGSVLKCDVQDLYAEWTLGKELGRGQFGVTFLATHNKTGEKAACKCISKRKLITKEDSEDVEREVAIMYHLGGHDNIVNLKQAYEDKNNVQLLMEIAEGGELFDRIVSKGHYSEKEAARAFRQIMKVVAQCHALGVMHRDLKPENFLLSSTKDDAQIKATDFGLSMFYQADQKFKDLVGSAYYVAPEVLKRSYGPEIDNWSAGVILYILLCGVPPFWGQSEQEIFRAVMAGKFDLVGDPWPKISAGAKDVVRRLLKQNPAERMTAAEALNHPWVREGGVATDTPIDDTIRDRLKNFTQANKFKKMALKIVASKLSDAEIKGLKEMFKAFDKDDSGNITVAELSEGLKNLSLQKKAGFGANQMTTEEIEALMASVDMDGDGTISYEEFIAATMHLNKLENEENLYQTFKEFDKDESGYIDEGELKEALKQYGIEFHDDEVKAMITDVDVNSDGQISYEEFQTMMRSKLHSQEQRARGRLNFNQ